MTTTYLGHAAHRLGRNQKHVLLVLSTRGASAASGLGWWPLREEQVRGAILSLAKRGLVDVAGFEGRSRTYRLTSAGFEVVDKHIVGEDDALDDGEDEDL